MQRSFGRLRWEEVALLVSIRALRIPEVPKQVLEDVLLKAPWGFPTGRGFDHGLGLGKWSPQTVPSEPPETCWLNEREYGYLIPIANCSLARSLPPLTHSTSLPSFLPI